MVNRNDESQIDVNRIADYFILRARETGEPITHLKLQKLVYYAQAWYLALNGKRLFNGDFQAWVHGPVSRDLYNRFRGFAWKPIDDEISEPSLPDDIREHLEEVWEVYGGFTAFDLERITHEEDPWLRARAGLPPDANCENVISDEDMKSYYRRRLEQSSASGTP